MDFNLRHLLIILLVSKLTVLVDVFGSIPSTWLHKHNQNQFKDPEMGLNTSELISLYNYTVKEYTVITEDGYFITIQRIPRGRHEHHHHEHHEQIRYPVLLMHGLDCTSIIWVDNMPNNSLGFILADNGYDVWLGNIRGSPYSREHSKYSVDSKEFWTFSWSENGEQDLPSIIDFILRKTGFPQLFYVGHSMGTTMGFALLSARPEYNDKIKGFVALAPVAYVSHILPDYQSMLNRYSLIQGMLKFTNQYRLTPTPAMKSLIANIFCNTDKKNCDEYLFKLLGKDVSLMNKTRIPLYVSHCSYGTSLNTLDHFMQVRKTNEFAKFDYGSKKINKYHYGSSSPPKYNLSQVTCPVALFWSEHDPLADPKDVSHLREQLPNVVLDYRVPRENFTHADFLWAGKKFVYKQLLVTLIEFQTLPKERP